MVNGDTDHEITMPNGKILTAAKITEELHLDPFVEAASSQGEETATSEPIIVKVTDLSVGRFFCDHCATEYLLEITVKGNEPTVNYEFETYGPHCPVCGGSPEVQHPVEVREEKE